MAIGWLRRTHCSSSVDGIWSMSENDLVFRLRKRAEIRMQIPSRTSVQEGKPDRLALLLVEAAEEIEYLRRQVIDIKVIDDKFGDKIGD